VPCCPDFTENSIVVGLKSNHLLFQVALALIFASFFFSLMIIKNLQNLLIFEFLLLISIFGKNLLLKERLFVKDIDADFCKCIIIFGFNFVL